MGPEGLVLLVEGTRALLRATTVEEVVQICCSVVRGMGGSVGPARIAGADAIPLDLSFGSSEPLLATASTREVRRLLEAVIPDLLEDAHAAVSHMRHSGLLAEEATVDGLTGLRNRRSIDRLLARLKAGDAVILMDLDRFKEVNDQLGHAAGDLVLTAFARVLHSQGRAGDSFGRLGGDEFLALLLGGDWHAADVLIRRLRAAWTEARPQPIDFSAGVAIAAGADAEAVLERADRALYAEKAAHRRDASPMVLGGAA